jgi:ribosomal protein L39E
LFIAGSVWLLFSTNSDQPREDARAVTSNPKRRWGALRGNGAPAHLLLANIWSMLMRNASVAFDPKRKWHVE